MGVENNIGLEATKNSNSTTDNKSINVGQFLTYIKSVALDEEKSGWAVYNEDGERLAVFGSYYAAYYSARQNCLNPTSIH